MGSDDNIRRDLNSLHLFESDMLKREWVTRVFDTVEKLHSKVEANTLQVQKEREEFFRALVELKDKLNDQINIASKEQAADLKTLEEKLSKFIEDVDDKFKESSTSFHDKVNTCSQDKLACIEHIRTELDDKIKNLVKDQITDRLGLTAVKAQFGAYVALVVIGVNVVLGVLATSFVMVFKEAIIKWLGH